MKLNNKGYLVVEVIVASVLAMTLAYFLLDLTVKLSNKNDDALVDTILTTDKALITKEIMSDVDNYKLIKVVKNNNKVIFTYKNDNKEITKTLSINDNTIKYGNYSKEISEYGEIGNLEVRFNTDNSIVYINIPITTKYSNIDYGINLIIPYSNETGGK